MPLFGFRFQEVEGVPEKKHRGQVDEDLFVCGGFASDAKSVGFVGSGVPEYIS